MGDEVTITSGEHLSTLFYVLTPDGCHAECYRLPKGDCDRVPDLEEFITQQGSLRSNVYAQYPLITSAGIF